MVLRRYYILVGRFDHGWELMFGDYSRRVVRDELLDTECHSSGDERDLPKSLRIIETHDDQASIDRAVMRLNEQPASPPRGVRGWVETLVI